MTYLGYKIAHDPGYKNKSDFFYYPGFKSVTCVGYALEGQFLLCTTYTRNKIKNRLMKNSDLFL